jgi:hypothetical protein
VDLVLCLLQLARVLPLLRGLEEGLLLFHRHHHFFFV